MQFSEYKSLIKGREFIFNPKSVDLSILQSLLTRHVCVGCSAGGNLLIEEKVVIALKLKQSHGTGTCRGMIYLSI